MLREERMAEVEEYSRLPEQVWYRFTEAVSLVSIANRVALHSTSVNF